MCSYFVPGTVLGTKDNPQRKFWENIYLFLIFIYLINLVLAVSGLSCGTLDLLLWPTGSSLRYTGFSLVVVHGLQSAWAL